MMTRSIPATMLAVIALSLGGCATMVPPVEVTRFHNAVAWAPGTRYVVATETGDASPSMEWSSYRAAVERQLQLQGLVATENAADAPLKVRIGFERSERVSGSNRSPVTIGVGGSTGSYGSGLGLGLGFNLGGGSRAVQDLRLSVRIDDAATGQALWEGRAEAAVPTKAPAAQPSLASAKLVDALFQGFPGESGRTIKVP